MFPPAPTSMDTLPCTFSVGNVPAGACADGAATMPAHTSTAAAMTGTADLRIWRGILTYLPGLGAGAMVATLAAYSGYIVSAPPRVGSNGRPNFAANSWR